MANLRLYSIQRGQPHGSYRSVSEDVVCRVVGDSTLANALVCFALFLAPDSHQPVEKIHPKFSKLKTSFPINSFL